MDFREYQERAMSTCMATSENFSYMMMNLVGEVGEFASKVAKGIRKDFVKVRDNRLSSSHLFEEEDLMKYVEMNDEMMKEAGDILWQLSGLCSVLGWSLEDVAEMNLAKLASRKDRGVIDGDGDNR